VITLESLRLMSTNVQILKVTSVYSLLAETHSLHVHYGCAVFTMTSRISSKAEHCCKLNHCRSNCCASGVHHIVMTAPPQQSDHRPVSVPWVVRIVLLNVIYKNRDIERFCQSSSTPVIKLAQPRSLAIPPVHHREDVTAAVLVDT